MPASPDRTTIVLPPRLKTLAVERARAEGISFGEFVRRALEKQVASVPVQQIGDPFWDNLSIATAPGPADIAEHHDDYLYGTKPPLPSRAE